MPSDPQKQQARVKVQTISLARRKPEKERGGPKVSPPNADLWLDEADWERADTERDSKQKESQNKSEGLKEEADRPELQAGPGATQSPTQSTPGSGGPHQKANEEGNGHRPRSSTGSPGPRGRFRPQALWHRFQKASPLRKGLTLCVVGLLGVGLLLAGHAYAQSVVDEAEVSVEQLMVLGTGIDSLQVRVTALVINSSPHSATFERGQLDVYYQGDKAGYLTVPELEYGPGENHFTLNLKLKQYARGPFAQLAAALISSLEVQVQVKGTLQTVGFPWFELVVDKEVNVRVFTPPYV